MKGREILSPGPLSILRSNYRSSELPFGPVATYSPPRSWRSIRPTKASELKGFFVPASYLKFAQDRLAKGIELEKSTPKDLNNEFHITFAQKKKNAER